MAWMQHVLLDGGLATYETLSGKLGEQCRTAISTDVSRLALFHSRGHTQICPRPECL